MNKPSDCLDKVCDLVEAGLLSQGVTLTAVIRRQNRLLDGDDLPAAVVSPVGPARVVAEYMPAGTIWEYSVRACVFFAADSQSSEAAVKTAADRATELMKAVYKTQVANLPSSAFQVEFEGDPPILPTGPGTRTYDAAGMVFRFQFDSTRAG